MNVAPASDCACADATERYRVSTPCTLLSVSPSLAALHAARFQNLHPDTAGSLTATHCSRCGAYAFDGQGSTLLVRRRKIRKRSGEPQRVYRKVCHMCGYIIDTPIPCLDTTTVTQSRAASSPFPLKRDLDSAIADTSLDKSDPPSKQETPFLQASTPPTPTKASLPPRPKRSQEKKAQTLREMLSRERQREEIKKAQKKHNTQGGLATFLKSL
ncbi:hypothetical protein EDD16DRAFT_1700955 [Pisolithus croceorrhizus]|nr:hypothetical protein EDD16DRAFT_1700955 [Pisolithus croceorrhizus]KAI6162994.1 hypothetical protein EDD17DRAFT_1477010 [Pisolithus thermaeus]